MPARKSLEPLQKIALNVYATDYERLRALYPEHGPQRVIRALVRGHLQKIDQKVAEMSEPLVQGLDIEISEEDLAAND